ncbi:maltokinase N-terminal cap-like domain-containing protein [Brevibacterium casei]|uniref:Predicted trehalose synthase n=1 Tax=Brevibacterium casei CIP 102111 TaxID=1255625 RepID=A0A2H1HQU9_9MICO|nr:hypothetical protein [Brevibacterium casei]QPR38481.1 hypothetical protein I6G94_12990 [Brevibacterium casei]QPR42647.1 hypothetical protein I6G93_10625 [Brevibacterium casei]SMX65299.1 Predicted trehalose synthase [Brevibacterium casei CIP 102111]
MAISSELEQLLARWIPRQSWFPKLAADFGVDPDITPMSVARAFTFTAEELGGFSGLVTVISVGDGPTLRRLNIPLSFRGAEDLHLRHALIGTVDDLALGRVFVYDGAADPVFVNLLADAITKRKVFDGGQLSTESLRHSRDRSELPTRGRTRETVPAPASATVGSEPQGSGAEAVPPKPTTAPSSSEVKDEIDVPIRPIEVADSGANKSTVIIHDEYEPVELSFFRVLENGMPSSLTIPVLLTEAGSRSVPEVIGWSSGRWYDMFEVTEMEAPMALLSQADVEAEPAWREAVDIVVGVDSGSIGGYNAHAAEMGRRIGELHSDMAAEFGIVEGAGEPTKQFVDKWIERIDWALGRAPLALDSLVPELKQHRNRLRSLDSIGRLQKIHGELTLDHVVSSPSEGYQVVKFTDSSNSDPKPIAIDLVALLRSVDYAAGFARLQRTEALNAEDGGLVVNGFGNDPAALRAIYDSPEYLWASQVQNSLLSGYSRARGESIGLNDPVLRAALIDRLLVEVVTELRNRPNWLSVPLATLTLILKGRPARSTDDPTEAELSVPATDAGADAGSSSEPSADGDADVASDESREVDATGGSAEEREAADVDEPAPSDKAGGSPSVLSTVESDSSGSGAATTDSDSATSDAGTAKSGSDTVKSASTDGAEPADVDSVGLGSAPESDDGARSDAADDPAGPTDGVDDSRTGGAAFVAGAAGVVGAAGVAGAAVASSADDERPRDDGADSSAATVDDATDGSRKRDANSSDGTDSAGAAPAQTENRAEDSAAAVADGDAVAQPGDGYETTDRDEPGDVTADGDTQVVMVDAVSTESVEPRQAEIAEMVPDAGGFVEPSVEAPNDVTETAPKATGPTAADSAAVSGESGRDGTTTSARGTTVTRTLFVGEATSTGGADSPRGDVRITGGAVVEDTYVDAVTTETVEAVNDGVPEVDLGVHDLAEVDVEARDETAVGEDSGNGLSDHDTADGYDPDDATEAADPALSPERDADLADSGTDRSAESVADEAPPLRAEDPGPVATPMPDAPPMPSEPPEVAAAPLPDAPAVPGDDAADPGGKEPGDEVPADSAPPAPEVADARAPKVADRGARAVADDEEFEDEEEADFVPSRVPATFAARGATSADADSTGRSPHEQHKHDGGPAREVPGEKRDKKGRNKH